MKESDRLNEIKDSCKSIIEVLESSDFDWNVDWIYILGDYKDITKQLKSLLGDDYETD